MLPVRLFKKYADASRLQFPGLIGVDCEGRQLGRFGKVELLTISVPTGIFIFDINADPALMNILRPVLASREIVKVFHDCREDASALLNVHAAPLLNVWDSQVAHNALLEREGCAAYQSSVEALSRIYGMKDFEVPTLPGNFKISPETIQYAASGVLPLANLFSEISRSLGDDDGSAMIGRSESYAIDYPKMNLSEIPEVSSLRPGLHLQGVLAHVSDSRVIFRLNLGKISGVAKHAKWLNACNVGDVVNLEISSDGLSACGEYLSVAARGEASGAVFVEKNGEIHAFDPSKVSKPKVVKNSLRGFQ